MPGINLKRNIMVSGAFRILIMAVIFLTSWLSTRYLGVELKGKYSYLVTIAGFAWMILDLGINKTYPYILRKEPEQAGNLIIWSFLLFGAQVLVLGLLGQLFLPFWSKFLGYGLDPLSLWLLIGLITLTQLHNHMQMFYLGLDWVKENSFWQLGHQVLMLMLVVVAAIFLRNADRLNIILVFSNLTMLAINLVLGSKYALKRKLSGFSLPKILSYYPMGFRVFLSSLLISLLLRADVMILKRMMGFESVGIYSLSAHMVDMMQLASNLVGSLLLVKLSDSSDDINRWILMKRIFILFVGLLSITNLGFALVGKPLIVLVYGAGFAGSYYAYLWLIPASFGLSLGSLFNTYLWSKGFPLISVILPGGALLSNIVLNLLLIPGMGVAGAGLASSISYLLWFISIVLYEQKLSGGRMLKHLIPCKADFWELWTMLKKLPGELFGTRD